MLPPMSLVAMVTGSKQNSWFHRSTPKAKARPAYTATAPSTMTPVNMTPQYTQDNQYKSTGIYPPLPGVTGARPTTNSQPGSPGSPYPGTGFHPTVRGQSDSNRPNYPVATMRGQSDSAGSNYPVAACRHSCGSNNLQNNVPQSTQYDQDEQIDRQLAIAEHNTNGRNIGQRNSNIE